MKKTVFMVCTVLLVLAALFSWPAQTVYADVLTDLGFSTSSQDLEDYDQRKDSQPYNSKNVTINPVVEEYLVEIGTDGEGSPTMRRSLTGDNDLGGENYLTEPIESGSLPVNDNKYVKAVAVDLNDEGKPHAAAELYYRDGSHGKGELWLTIVNAGGEVEWNPDNTIVDPGVNLKSAATNEICVFSNSGGSEPLITDYKNQHVRMQMVAGDFDNDGVSEIVVYVPEAGNPHLALYQVDNGVIQATPEQTFTIPSPYAAPWLPTVYMAAGDLTGDNLPDLVLAYSGTSYSKISIFKSQDFSFSRPHIWSDGSDYYEPGIYDAAVAIGKVSGWHEHPIGLVIAGYSTRAPNTDIEIKYQDLLYLPDQATGTWNFLVLNNGGYFEEQFNPLYNYGPINIACVEMGATTECIYINGLLMEGGPLNELGDDSVNPPSPENVRYFDYDVIAGNFDGNSLGYEELRIIREKQTNQGTDNWVSAGLELVTVDHERMSVTSLDPGITCAALAAPNTDDDTVIMKYKGHDVQYSYPTVLAVLASPPYFEDLEHLDGGDGYIGDSSTEITSGEGSGSETHGSVSVTAGAYASLESEVSIFGIKIAQAEYETEFTAGYTWDTSHETEVSTAISYGTFGGQDSVAIYTIPMDVFTYEVWCPGAGGKGGYWTTMKQCFPYPAAYVVIPADQYDEIASRENSLPRVSGELFKHTLGRPETYHRSSDNMFNVKDPIELAQFNTVGYGNAYTAQSIEITETDTDSHTFEAEMSHRVGGGVAGATAGITFSIGGGGGWATTTIKNVGYTGTLMNMPLEAENGGYSFDWKLVAYPYVSESQNFPVVTYAVDQVRRPPLLPRNLEMVSSTQDSITLTWDNVDPNVTGYQLYRYYDFEGNLAGYKKIGNVIPVGTTSFTDTGLQPYTSYSYKIQSIGMPYGGMVTESVGGPECIARTAPDADAPVITQQPESVEVAAGSRAVFQVIAQPAPSSSISDPIFYQWQSYENGRWESLADGQDNLLAINGVVKEDAGRYRCAVSQYVQSTPITIYSTPATLTVNKNHLDIELSLEPSVPYGDRNEPVTIRADLNNTDPQIPPTGKINFLFTYYSDPVIPIVEGVPQEPEYPDPVLSMQEVTVVNGSGAQIVWTPPGYGSYDIAAVYLGDNNYHQSTSPTSSFTCTAGGSSSASGLRVTGIENNTLTYGDVIDLGATVWQDGSLETLLTDEVAFTSSDPAGLTVAKLGGSNPKWQLTAAQTGTYELTAEAVLGGKTLKVTKNIFVNKAQITLKAVDQYISQGNGPAPFTMELTAGELKLGDSLDTVFTVDYRCIATPASPAGEYDIFVENITQQSDNYEILGIEQGIVIIEGPTYNIKFRGVSNGTVQAQINGWRNLEQDFVNGYEIAAGDYVRFNALPNSGYRVEKWVLNGSEIKKEDNSYDTSAYITTSSLSQDVTVEVYFVPDMCSLTYSAGANGTVMAQVGNVTVGSGAVLPSQTVLAFTAAPQEDYMVNQWIINNVASSQKGENFYLTITQDTDVQVTFAPAEYVPVSFAATGSGQVTAETAGGAVLESGSLVTKGSEVVFSAVPNDANSMIKEWKVNGQVVQGNTSVYTAQNIQQALHIEVVFIDAITYTVIFGAIGSGSLTAEVDGTAITSGQQVRGCADIVFTAHPPAGWQVKEWKLGTNLVLDGAGLPWQSESYTLEELIESITVTVEFESTQTYTVDYSVVPDGDGNENGTITARATSAGLSSNYTSGDTLTQGSQVMLTAVPDSNYRVKEWVVNNQTVTESVYSSYTVEAIDRNYVITVEFEQGQNPLTFAAVGHGTVTAAVYGEDNITSGRVFFEPIQVTFTAAPENGYQVKAWHYNGEPVQSNNTDTYILTVNNGGFVEVEFEREYYTLTLGQNLNASVDGEILDNNLVQGDKTVTVTASPPAGSVLTAWYKDGVLLDGEQSNTYTFIMEQDTEITAGFSQQSFTVTFTAGEHGTLTATANENVIISGGNHPGGCAVMFTAQPEAGYRVKNWYRGTTEISGQLVSGTQNQTYTIDMLSKPEYVRVYFEEMPGEPVGGEYLVSFSAGSGGSISAAANGHVISSGASVAAGSRVTFTAQADTGKTIAAWSGIERGTLSADKLVFTIASLAAAENVQVTFKAVESAPSGGGGGGGLPPVSPNQTGTLMTSSGGKISEAGVQLTIPAGAVEEEIQVQVKEAALTAGMSIPDNSMLVSKVVDIIKDSSEDFSKPVTISLYFDKSKIDPEKFDIRICYYDEEADQWVPLDNLQVNLTTGQVSGDVIHFTKFAVIATPKINPSMEQPQPTLTIPADMADHWAKDSVMKLMEAKIISGYQDGTFQPDQSITRAEFTVLMVKALQLEANDGKAFADISTHWAQESIITAAGHGIISGYDDGTFGPDDPITREQAASITARAARLERGVGAADFTDSHQISSWAGPGVAAAVNGGFFSGYPDGSFRPHNNISRAESAVITAKLLP